MKRLLIALPLFIFAALGFAAQMAFANEPMKLHLGFNEVSKELSIVCYSNSATTTMESEMLPLSYVDANKKVASDGTKTNELGIPNLTVKETNQETLLVNAAYTTSNLNLKPGDIVDLQSDTDAQMTVYKTNGYNVITTEGTSMRFSKSARFVIGAAGKVQFYGATKSSNVRVKVYTPDKVDTQMTASLKNPVMFVNKYGDMDNNISGSVKSYGLPVFNASAKFNTQTVSNGSFTGTNVWTDGNGGFTNVYQSGSKVGAEKITISLVNLSPTVTLDVNMIALGSLTIVQPLSALNLAVATYLWEATPIRVQAGDTIEVSHDGSDYVEVLFSGFRGDSNNVLPTKLHLNAGQSFTFVQGKDAYILARSVSKQNLTMKITKSSSYASSVLDVSMENPTMLVKGNGKIDNIVTGKLTVNDLPVVNGYVTVSASNGVLTSDGVNTQTSTYYYTKEDGSFTTTYRAGTAIGTQTVTTTNTQFNVANSKTVEVLATGTQTNTVPLVVSAWDQYTGIAVTPGDIVEFKTDMPSPLLYALGSRNPSDASYFRTNFTASTKVHVNHTGYILINNNTKSTGTVTITVTKTDITPTTSFILPAWSGVTGKYNALVGQLVDENGLPMIGVAINATNPDTTIGTLNGTTATTDGKGNFTFNYYGVKVGMGSLNLSSSVGGAVSSASVQIK